MVDTGDLCRSNNSLKSSKTNMGLILVYNIYYEVRWNASPGKKYELYSCRTMACCVISLQCLTLPSVFTLNKNVIDCL